MKDYEKFEGFVEQMIEDNEAKFGYEMRQKYGDEAIDASNKRLRGLSQTQFEAAAKLEAELKTALLAAMQQGNTTGEVAMNAASLHKQWLCVYWDAYSADAHMGVAQMYVDDERFMEYYDKWAKDAAVFLRDAVVCYCS